MSTERIDALESLLKIAGHCMRLSGTLVSRFQSTFEHIDDGKQALPHNWSNLRQQTARSCEFLKKKHAELTRSDSRFDLYRVVEEANLDHLRPVRFREYDFMVVTEATEFIAAALAEDFEAWSEYEDQRCCEEVAKTWARLTHDQLRDWALQVEIECRRAIRDEYDWLERQQTGEIEEGQLRFRDKVAVRRKRVKELRKEHKTASNWSQLAQLAQADEQIKSLGLPAITRHTVRNDCIPPKRRRGKT